MNRREAAKILGAMQLVPWRGKWTEEHEDWWLRYLVSFTGEESIEAVAMLATSIDFVPTPHEFEAAVHVVRDRLRREAEEKRALRAAKDMPEITDVGRREIRLRRLIQKRAREKSAHRHVGMNVDACPLCAEHDHSEVTAYGFTRQEKHGRNKEGEPIVLVHDEPVPAWWFTCPVDFCGWPERAALACDRWSPAGVAWWRAFRDDGTPSHSDLAAARLLGEAPPTVVDIDGMARPADKETF